MVINSFFTYLEKEMALILSAYNMKNIIQILSWRIFLFLFAGLKKKRKKDIRFQSLYQYYCWIKWPTYAGKYQIRQGLKLTFWLPDRKFWLPTYFKYNLHQNTILSVTSHARKVTIEERKQLKTTRVTLSYKATVVFRWYASVPKVMVVSIVILNEAKHKTF